MDDNATGAAREYRAEELAAAAGIPVRTLRFYRERRLLPPPRRDGRIAWYSEDHLTRLRTIAALLERGHTLGGIADLIAAWEKGRTLDGVAELLGLDGTLPAPWSEETPVRLTAEDLAHYFGQDISPENLTAALEIGYIAIDGENVVHISRRLLEASAALVREGVPLSAVLAAGREVRHHVDAIAALFTDVIERHLLGPTAGPRRGDAQHVTDALRRLRPLAKNVVEAEMSLAMDRRARAELDGRTHENTGTATPPPHRTRVTAAPSPAQDRPNLCTAPRDLPQWKGSRSEAGRPGATGSAPTGRCTVQNSDDTGAEAAILGRISQMVADEKSLRDLLAAGGATGESDRSRLTAIEHELDQCWDLLRQRRALSEAGEDPGGARVRPSSTVEGYRS